MSAQMRSTSVIVASLLLLLMVGGMEMKLVQGEEQEVKCKRQISSGQLSQCIEYLVYGHQGPPDVFQARYNSEILDQCCKQLNAVEQECRCDAINQMLREEEKHIESLELEGVVRRARNLPAMCNMEPHRCDFQVAENKASSNIELQLVVASFKEKIHGYVKYVDEVKIHTITDC